VDYGNSVSRRSTVYSQRLAAYPERCISADFQSRAARPRQRQSDRITLAANPLAHYMLMHGIITGKYPDFLRIIVHPAISISSHPGLRLATFPAHNTTLYEFGRRVFSYAGQAAWNSLSATSGRHPVYN